MPPSRHFIDLAQPEIAAEATEILRLLDEVQSGTAQIKYLKAAH